MIFVLGNVGGKAEKRGEEVDAMIFHWKIVFQPPVPKKFSNMTV
jgi:hypothetical protein